MDFVLNVKVELRGHNFLSWTSVYFALIGSLLGLFELQLVSQSTMLKSQAFEKSAGTVSEQRMGCRVYNTLTGLRRTDLTPLSRA